MARKNVIISHKMLNEAALTGDSTSLPTDVVNLDRASISIAWSNSDAVGEIQFEARKIKKSQPEVLADTEWYTLDFGATIDISGASGTHEVIFDALDFTQLRVKYVSTSGTTGEIDAVLTAKQIGG